MTWMAEVRRWVVPSTIALMACGGGMDVDTAEHGLAGAMNKKDKDTSAPTTSGVYDGNLTCPSGYETLKVEPPRGGSFSGGGMQVQVTAWTATSFQWSSNVGIDLVLVKGGPKTAVFAGDEMTSGTATAPNNPRSGKPYDISHYAFCRDKEPPGPAPTCPAGHMSLTVPNPKNGTYAQGTFSVEISNMMSNTFDWRASNGVDMIVVSDASGHTTVTMHEVPNGSAVSAGTGPITEVTFCYDDDVIRLCGDEYACPEGMTAWTITDPADGYYTDGLVHLWISNFSGSSFHWNTTHGIDAILLISEIDTCNYWHPEASSGDASMLDGSRIHTATFCYDQP